MTNGLPCRLRHGVPFPLGQKFPILTHFFVTQNLFDLPLALMTNLFLGGQPEILQGKMFSLGTLPQEGFQLAAVHGLGGPRADLDELRCLALTLKNGAWPNPPWECFVGRQ